MSWQAMDAIDRIPYDACKPLEFRVLTKLANVAAQDGTRAFRSISEMSNELGVSHRSIQRALKALEGDRIIIRGEQRHLAHLRADKRPTVYDINMPKCLDWEGYHADVTPSLDGVTSGVTELSTDPHGVTSGVTTAVVHKELIELTTKRSLSNHRADVTPLCTKGHPIEVVSGSGIGYCAFGCPSGGDAA